MSNLNTHYISGEHGTTGREPFEDTSNISTGQTGGFGQGTGAGVGVGGGYGQGLKDDVSSGGASYGDSYGQAPAVSGQHIGTGAGLGIGGEHHGHHHHGHHGHHGGETGQSAAGTAVGTGVGTGASQAIGGEGHHSHHTGHHDRQQHSHHQSGVPGPGSTNPTGEGYGGIGASETGSHVDRVGPQGQGQAAYERTGAGGPATTGAAGTDRFDTGPVGAAHGSAEGQDTSQRAPGKGLGGVEGVLGTSDKDFTGRDRAGGGALSAYADTDGPFNNNTSGPKGNTALTGREGNLDNNPVAQAKSNETGTRTTGSANTAVEDDGQEKKGFMDKIKDVLHK